MGIFSEYLNSKGKIEKPVVKDVADKVDVPAEKAKHPPKAHNQSKPKNYSDGKTMKKAEKGFGEEGDKDLVYDVTKTKEPAKIPTAESIQLAKAVSSAVVENPFLVEHLIAELKKKKTLGVLVGEMFTHNETFRHLAEIMASKDFGPSACRKLVRAMKEEVAPPFEDFGLDEFDDEMEDDEIDPNAPDEMMDDPSLGDEDMDFLSQMAGDEEMPMDGEDSDDMEGAPMDGEVPPERNKLAMPPALEHLMRAISSR